MILHEILKKSLDDKNISDIILSAGSKPCFKINGDISYLDNYEILTNKELITDISGIMNDNQKKNFKNNLELDFSIELKGHSRFRINVFHSKTGIGVVFRPISGNIPNCEDIDLPKGLIKLLDNKSGLLLVTGSVGSGKSTTLASLIDNINSNQSKHIVTIEDPIEFIFTNKKSLIEQREVSTNTKTFENGLKYSLRQATDVIMIGEMRDMETFRLALRSAETGNLVIATLHTSGSARTISRIIDMFPGDEKEQIRSQLADSLLGIIWQKLIKTKDGKKRVLASEFLINNLSISNMIRKGNIHQINSAIETGVNDGMYSMESYLNKLKTKGII